MGGSANSLGFPRISVVMAVYNGGAYTSQAIESILGQTFTDFELILVNDGSSDGTADLFASYADPRIRILTNEQNIGLTRSLNRGIQASRGEYIARQDADDISLPERLAAQLEFLERNPAVGLVGSGARWIDAQGSLIRDWIPISGPRRIQEMLLFSVPFLHGTFMIRSACLANAGGGYDEEIPVAQDCDLLLRLSELCDIDNIQQILYLYREHAGAISSKRKDDQEKFLQLGRQHAVQRRMAYGLGYLGLRKYSLPEKIEKMDRTWMAERFVAWSASTRQMEGAIALKFLLLAILLNPFTKYLWGYLGGILRRKVISSNKL
jgi:glycosyltransferase involved in cell wall biosynthesis